MPTTIMKTKDLLVVDLRPDDYLQLAAEVDAAEYRFLYATCGDEALRIPRKSLFGLWLINIDLPDMSGLDLLALVRSRDPGAACILVGDTYSEAEELSARQLGATFYGCKPPQAAWLRALPAFRTPVIRDHLAHGPPETRAAPAGLPSSVYGGPLRSKPES